MSYLEPRMDGFYDEFEKISAYSNKRLFRDIAPLIGGAGALTGALSTPFGKKTDEKSYALRAGKRALVGGAIGTGLSLGGSALAKMAHELTQSERTDFAQPKKEEEGHKGKYPIPDKKHYGIALGFAKMHHDSGALKAIHAKGKAMGYTKEAEGFGSPNISDTDEMAKMAGRSRQRVSQLFGR